jgi:hypothetical protein
METSYCCMVTECRMLYDALARHYRYLLGNHRHKLRYCASWNTTQHNATMFHMLTASLSPIQQISRKMFISLLRLCL